MLIPYKPYLAPLPFNGCHLYAIKSFYRWLRLKQLERGQTFLPCQNLPSCCLKKCTECTPPGVNFIIVFRPSFYAQRSQKHKKLLDLTVFFGLLGSASIKTERKMLVKFTPVCVCLCF